MPLRVLYLDDEQVLLENFVDMYASPEIEISVFSDPQVAQQEIQKNPPDLLVLDHRLPGITGDQIGLTVGQSIPMVLLTGELLYEPSAPFLRVFTKPYDSKEMDAFLKTRLALKVS